MSYEPPKAPPLSYGFATDPNAAYPPVQAAYPPPGQPPYPPGQPPYPPGEPPYHPDQSAAYPPQAQQPAYPGYTAAAPQYTSPSTGPDPSSYGATTASGLQHHDYTTVGAPEPGFAKASFSDQDVRRAFIKRVYSILSIQLIVTCAIIALFTFHEPTKLFVKAHSYLLWVALGGTLVIIIALACFDSIRRKHPLNIILLAVFTLFEGFLLGAISSSYDVESVFIAAGSTAAVTIGLTIFAFQTKFDFTKFGPYLFVALIVLMLFGLFIWIFGAGKITLIIYGSLGALLFSFYLVFDTQLMLGEKHKYSLSPDEYIMAALNLYIDIVQIFMYLLMIIGIARD